MYGKKTWYKQQGMSGSEWKGMKNEIVKKMKEKVRKKKGKKMEVKEIMNRQKNF